MKKSIFFVLLFSVSAVTFCVHPSVSQASWWNPFTWFSKSSSVQINTVVSSGVESPSKKIAQISISTPTYDDVLEPGATVPLEFTSVSGAQTYNVSIVLTGKSASPHVLDLTLTNTKGTITIPQTQNSYLVGGSLDGSELVVQALDKDGRIVGYGRNQIRILPQASNPNLLKASSYIVSGNGGAVTRSTCTNAG
jgi:hypothetical protein